MPVSEAEVSAEVRILDAQSHLLERDEMRQTAPGVPRRAGRLSGPGVARDRAGGGVADAIAKKVLECHRKMSGR